MPAPLKRRSSVLWCIAVASTCLTPSTELRAQDSSNWPLVWAQWHNKTRDWGGIRTDLSDKGLDLGVLYTQDVAANPAGGMKQSLTYGGRLEGMAKLDFDKIFGIKNSSLHYIMYQGLGQGLSQEAIGNDFGVTQIFSSDILAIANLSLQQKLYHDQVYLSAGRLAVGDIFARDDTFAYYLNGALNSTPGQLLINQPAFTTYPFNTWGVAGTYTFPDNQYVGLGVYDANVDDLNNAEHGFNFRFQPEGNVLVVGQVGVNPGKDDTSQFLPGHYQLGAYYNSGTVDVLGDSTETREGNWGLYGIARQMVYQEEGDQGLSLWGLFTMAPQQAINTQPYGVSGGFFYQGLLPNRDDDVTAGAFILGFYSDNLVNQSYELVFEFAHRYQFRDWSYLTLDFQYVVNPAGNDDIPDAWVFGTEFSVKF
ncbi:carbohydrate porin [Pseudovibrio sp. SCP19]|uniref:carbohydrate porin n=1 Tax=Pseudovibrio sp. SCP19 TaxID=3141374 RepID=UPI00333A63E4